MSDLIERQMVIDEIKSHYRMHDNDLLELIVYKIENLPSVQPELFGNSEQLDQPEIILCKDCVYSHMTYNTYSGECKYCDMWGQIYESTNRYT